MMHRLLNIGSWILTLVAAFLCVAATIYAQHDWQRLFALTVTVGYTALFAYTYGRHHD